MRRPSTVLLALILLATLVGACSAPVGAGPDRPVKILTGAAETLDPAIQGDAGSAAIMAQLFETLTTFDADLHVQPALAASWIFADGGRQVTFNLRPDLAFSDGSPLRPSDVRRSWLRIIDPQAPSPLTSLIVDVKGAAAFLAGDTTDPTTVGITADDSANTLIVDLIRPATDFASIVASPTFAVVPPGVGSSAAALEPGPGFVGSGGYVATATSPTGITLTSNPHYWAGKPAITTIELVGTLGGASPVEAFEAGDLDYTPISGIDASWIAYDKALGPQMRDVASLSLQYYGFTTSRPPFDDVKVRKAFGEAVDWRRIVALADTDGTLQVANSMVPPGIPGRSDTDFLPKYDPNDARALLAQAGYPDGAGFPATVLLTSGGGFDDAIVAEIQRELNITMTSEVMGAGYFGRLGTDPPAMWSLGWVADYPGRNDFLGVLLRSGSSNDYGKWSSPDFDTAIDEAVAATDPAAASAAFDRAEAIVRDEVPVVPLAYGSGAALSRTGLLGTGQNGLGIIRMAGLAWSE